MNDVIFVPMEALSDHALVGVIEAFILREGTDYGHRDFTLEEKRAHVRQMLEKDLARIVYYPDEDYVDLQLTD